jgi:hypothetical protein
MAQADSVPSSSRQLITGESASQSTNLRAINLPAVIEPGDRRNLIGGSQAPVIIGSDKASLLRQWWEKRGDGPEDLLKCRWDGATGQAPLGSNIEALFFANAAFLLARLLRRIVRIPLLFVSRNKRLRIGPLDKVSSNQLVKASSDQLVPLQRQEKLK